MENNKELRNKSQNIYKNLMYVKGNIKNQWVKGELLNKWCWDNLSTIQKNQIQITPSYHIPKYITDGLMQEKT